MSDKHEQAAHNVALICGFDEISYANIDDRDKERLISYLLETFPEPVKIEGVRELINTIRTGNCGWYAPDTDIELLISDFIQQREAWDGIIRDCCTCRYKKISHISGVKPCEECRQKAHICFEKWQPLPPAPHD